MATTDPSPRALMACIGDASRFRLVQALLGGARCVTDLAGEVGLSQSCTTRHLQALERRRVVCGARDGKRVMYRLCHEEPALEPLLAWALSPEGALAGATPSAPRRSAGPVRKRRANSMTSPKQRARKALRPDPTPLAPPPGKAGHEGRTDGDRASSPAETHAPRPARNEIEDYLL